MSMTARSSIRPAFTAKEGVYCCAAAACLALIFVYFKECHSNKYHAQTPRHNQTHWTSPLRSRGQLAEVLQAEGKKVGIELGVQHGRYSAQLLSVWKNCERMYLVDMWREQSNYKDMANVGNAQQEQILAEARQIHKPYGSRSVFIRNTTLEAADIIEEPVDFVYVDARHDYCGTSADIAAYWPKLKRGGLMAGHDYLTASEVRAHTPGQDWSLCMNGSVHESAVKGAVDDFFIPLGVPVFVTYADGPWVTWYVRKG